MTMLRLLPLLAEALVLAGVAAPAVAQDTRALEWSIKEWDLESTVRWTRAPDGGIELEIDAREPLLCHLGAPEECRAQAGLPSAITLHVVTTVAAAVRLVDARGRIFAAEARRLDAEYHGLPRSASPMEQLFWAFGEIGEVRERWLECPGPAHLGEQATRLLNWLSRRYGVRHRARSFRRECRGGPYPTGISVGVFVEPDGRRWTCSIGNTGGGAYCCAIDCRAQDRVLEEAH